MDPQPYPNQKYGLNKKSKGYQPLVYLIKLLFLMGVPSGKLTSLAGISPFLIENPSSIRVHVSASYVSLPDCS